jgi:hypothetical protein
VLALLAACSSTALAGCRPSGVRISYRPARGAQYTYRVEVHAEVTTTIADTPPRRTVDDSVLEAHHLVLAGGRDGSSVQVRLTGPGEPARTFVVRLDRAGHLAEVQRVEGLPARALGGLGLSEIFPAAAGVAPDRLLAPGSRWQFDEPVALPGEPATHLRGAARLLELGVVNGHKVADVRSSFRLPVRRTSDEAQGRIVIDGEQVVQSKAESRVDDGSLERVETETRGTFTLTLTPNQATAAGTSVPGTVTVVVRSVTTRLR